MKAVLISIQPKWCELIASGKKTVEVRKSRPKLETPFRCYIYCTNEKGRAFFTKGENGNYNPARLGNSKVIGEFVCDSIFEFESELWDDETYERIVRVVHKEDWEGYPETESYYVAEDGEDNYLCRQSCLTWEDLRGYVGQDINTFFGWHISDLKIYDKPKELREFRRYPRTEHCGFGECELCRHGDYDQLDDEWFCRNYIARAPQSWCYVED